MLWFSVKCTLIITSYHSVQYLTAQPTIMRLDNHVYVYLYCRYTVQTVENLESKGSFTQITEPYQEALSSIEQLWRNEYKYTMREIKDYFPRNSIQTGLKYPEDFLQVILTSALQVGCIVWIRHTVFVLP